jgi:hypothetical protein
VTRVSFFVDTFSGQACIGSSRLKSIVGVGEEVQPIDGRWM